MQLNRSCWSMYLLLWHIQTIMCQIPIRFIILLLATIPDFFYSSVIMIYYELCEDSSHQQTILLSWRFVKNLDLTYCYCKCFFHFFIIYTDSSFTTSVNFYCLLISYIFHSLSANSPTTSTIYLFSLLKLFRLRFVILLS